MTASAHPDREAIAAAADAVARGGVVVYPTETVYGLGVAATQASAVARLLDLKGRDAGKGVSLLVLDLAMAEALIEGAVPLPARALADRFWPGPLTIVLPARKPALPRALLGANGGVGLRCSSDPWASALLAEAAVPITSSSANRAGCEPSRTVAQAHAIFGSEVDCYLDGGQRCDSSVSTVVEFLNGGAYLRRSGAVDREALARVVALES